MKVAVLTEAGSDVGFGHLTRCTAICQGFEERGILPELIVKVAGDFGGKFEYKNYRIFDWIKSGKLIKELLQHTDMAVVDSYLAGADIYRIISGNVDTGVYFDDTQRLSYPEGVVVNGAVDAENIPYLQKNGSDFLLGTRFTPLRKVFWDMGEKNLNKELTDVLITLGGRTDADFLEELLTALASRLSGPKWHLVLSSDSSFCPSILAGIDASVYSNADSRRMCELMLKCDVCICAGGQTTYELARAGTPAVAVCAAENQKYNLEGWKRAGFINQWFQMKDDDIFDGICDEVETLMIAKTREQRGRIGRSKIDGQGVRRTVSFLLDKAGRGN